MHYSRSSRIHHDLRQGRLVGRGTVPFSNNPHGLYKEYPRMPRIPLPATTALDRPLREALANRRSAEPSEFHGGSLSLEHVAALFETLRIGENGRRPYPSGGALYPIETYLVGAVGTYSADVFHYNAHEHSLEHLWKIPEAWNAVDICNDAIVTERAPAVTVIFTTLWGRSVGKYGDFSFELALLEAGHMAQNIVLAAAASGVLARPVAGFGDIASREILDLGADTSEQPVYTIVLG